MDDRIKKAIANNSTLAGALRELGRSLVGTNYKWLKQKIVTYGLDTSHWKGRAHGISPQPNRVVADDIFVENCKHARGTVKRFLIKNAIIPYVCSVCSAGPEWRGRPISLILDHVNGAPNDCRKENLRFLCPNCNAQTDTYCGKNVKNRTKTEPMKCKCGKPSPTGCCKSCSQKQRHNIPYPPLSVLLEKILKTKTLTVAQELGISVTSLKKHVCKEVGIPKHEYAKFIRSYGLSGRSGDSNSPHVSSNLTSCTTFVMNTNTNS